MAGRNISVDHEALGAVRVMRTCGIEGEVIGMAAALCAERDASPREVYEEHLAGLQNLLKRGAGKVEGAKIPYENHHEPKERIAAVARRRAKLAAPAWLKTAGENLARTARVTTPGATASTVQTELLINDGAGLVEDNATRWVSRAALPHWIEFSWDEPVQLGAARIISGYYRGGGVEAPIEDFTFQWHDGARWVDVPGASAVGNAQPAWASVFERIETKRLRLAVTATKDDTSRIWEVELYGPPPDSPR